MSRNKTFEIKLLRSSRGTITSPRSNESKAFEVNFVTRKIEAHRFREIQLNARSDGFWLWRVTMGSERRWTPDMRPSKLGTLHRSRKLSENFARMMRLGMEQNILRIAWNHSSLIRDFWFKLSHAQKHLNDFTVFLPQFPLPRCWVRNEKKTFLTLFAILIYSLRELCSEYVLCVFDVKKQRKQKTRGKCASDVWNYFLWIFNSISKKHCRFAPNIHNRTCCWHVPKKKTLTACACY